MTKTSGAALQAELKSRGKNSYFFHSGLEDEEKKKIHGLLGNAIVIATTG
jgi:hypothetical protein